MKNTFINLICLSISTIFLSACSTIIPSANTETNKASFELPVVTTTENKEHQTEIITETSVNTVSTATTTPENKVHQTEIITETYVNTVSTATTAPETEVESILTPSDIYMNFKPLYINVFNGNEVNCKPEIYAEQIRLIDNEIENIYGKNYAPSLEAKLLISALLSNQNIESKYKKWLFHMIEYFNDNEYIQREEIYDKLQTMQIEVQVFDEDDEERLYGAQYILDESKIIFYIDASKEYVDYYMSSAEYEETGLSYVDNDVYNLIKHEIFHNTVSGKVDNLCGFLNEGITVILVEEYNMGNIDLYDDHRVLYIKMLIELIGKDKVLEAYSKSDWSIIEEALLEIDPDTSKPQRMYDLMVEWDEAWINAECDYFTVRELTEDIRAEMSQILTEYYNIVYPYADEDSLFSIYELYFSGNPEEYYHYISEAYFNSRYEEDWFIERKF